MPPSALNSVFLQKFRGQIARCRPCSRRKVQEVESRKAREQQVADRLRELNHSLFEAKQRPQASRTKDLFLANISHELRTPLTVTGYAEILIDEATEADRLGDLDLFQHIHASARHLLTLINDILDLSKIEAGKVELVPEWVDVRMLVESINGDVSKLAATRGDRLEVEIGRRADMMGLTRRGSPDPAQHRAQCREVHEERRRASRSSGVSGGEGPHDVQSVRHRHRDARAEAEALSGVRAGRRGDQPRVRRHGSGSRSSTAPCT